MNLEFTGLSTLRVIFTGVRREHLHSGGENRVHCVRSWAATEAANVRVSRVVARAFSISCDSKVRRMTGGLIIASVLRAVTEILFGPQGHKR
jgi:hypothetical protein